MTTISMNAGNSAYFANRSARGPARVCRPAGSVGTPRRLGAGPVREALATTGSLTLALVPFSLLAWMFVAG